MDPILRAVSQNNLVQVRQLIVTNPEALNTVVDFEKNTPLLLAAKLGFSGIAFFLLEQPNIDLTQTNCWGRNVLHTAAVGGCQDLVKHLVSDRGFKLSDFTKSVVISSRHTVLHCAALGGHQALLVWLRSQGIALSLPDHGGATAIHYAAWGGHQGCIEWLMGEGLQLKSVNDRGTNALHYASRGGHQALASWLCLQGFSLREKNNQGRMAIHYAAWGGHQKMVEALVSQDPLALSVSTDIGTTVTHFAAWGGHQALLAWLQSQGCELDKADHSGATVIHFAAWGGHRALLEWLETMHNFVLAAATDRGGTTTLHFAAWGGHKELLVWLLHKGLRLDTKNKMGRGVINYAARGAQPEMLTFLLVEKNCTFDSDTPFFIMSALELSKINFGYNFMLCLVDQHGIDFTSHTDFYRFLSAQRDEIKEHLRVHHEIQEIWPYCLEESVRLEELYKKLTDAPDTGNHLFRLQLLASCKNLLEKVALLAADFGILHNPPSHLRQLYAELSPRWQELTRQCYQHPFIKNNWVRLRIWESGYYTNANSNGGSASYQQQSTSRLGVKYIWHRLTSSNNNNPADNVGHVSLETSEGYVSFWPDDVAGMRGKLGCLTETFVGVMRDLIFDQRAEGCNGNDPYMAPSNKQQKPADETIELYTLNVQQMNTYIRETICPSIRNNVLGFSLLGHNSKKLSDTDYENASNCVTLTYNILLAGGLQAPDLIPNPEATYPGQPKPILDPEWMLNIANRLKDAETKRTMRGEHHKPKVNLNVAPFGHEELAPYHTLRTFRIKDEYSHEDNDGMSLMQPGAILALLGEAIDGEGTLSFLSQAGDTIVLDKLTVASALEEIIREQHKSQEVGKMATKLLGGSHAQ